jgi:hypothetical protein
LPAGRVLAPSFKDHGVFPLRAGRGLQSAPQNAILTVSNMSPENSFVNTKSIN